jgi:hypothetical protein
MTEKWSDEDLAEQRARHHAVRDGEFVTVKLRRHEWRVVQRALTRHGHYLVRRAVRPSSIEGGADERELDRVRGLSDVIATAAGNDEGFV